MTEAPHEVEAEAPVVFRQRRHALLLVRPSAPAQSAPSQSAPSHPAESTPAESSPESRDAREGTGTIGAARLAFADGALSLDKVFAAIIGAGPLSEVAPFVYLTREGNGLRVFARGPLRVEELPSAPHVGIRPAVISAGEASTWVEVLLPSARGVEVTVENDRRGLDQVPIQLLFAACDEEISETRAPVGVGPETVVAPDPDIDTPNLHSRALDSRGTDGPDSPDTDAASSLDGEDSGHIGDSGHSSDAISEATILDLPPEATTTPGSDSDSGSGSGSDDGVDAPRLDRDELPILDQSPIRDVQTFPVPILDPEVTADQVGEHDGRTILSAEASRIRQEASARRAARQEFRDGSAQQPAAHATPPASEVLEAPAALDEVGEHDGLTIVGGSLRDLRVDDAHRHESAPRGGDLADTVLVQAFSSETRPEADLASLTAHAADQRRQQRAVDVSPDSSAEQNPPEQNPPAQNPPEQRASGGEASYIVELSTGATVDLAGPLVLGRAPSMGAEQTGGVLPRHVKLTGATDISRNHVLLTVEGGVIVVTDLHSRNGTDVVMPGRGPQRLRAGEPTAVMPDTVIDLGSGVFLTVRNLAMTARR
ncbi:MULTISPECIES: FHA domain-containing protein [unclassified Pseudoclavibacter]|uniref:FHA domain-containing protein n=1 Tax=unclassified Pseudoclavibacter TaxID=2615177 RepID=UPI0021572071|nr:MULTISPECIES: FHA domain-containing protein [unclassified Pseudoclavibacter]